MGGKNSGRRCGRAARAEKKQIQRCSAAPPARPPRDRPHAIPSLIPRRYLVLLASAADGQVPLAAAGRQPPFPDREGYVPIERYGRRHGHRAHPSAFVCDEYLYKYGPLRSQLLSIPRFPFPPISGLSSSFGQCLSSSASRQAISFDVIRYDQRTSPPLNRRRSSQSHAARSPASASPRKRSWGSSLVETLCPVLASCCVPYRAAENCLSWPFWPVSIIKLCNTPSCGLAALRRGSHGDNRCGTLSQHPRKCDVHPHLWHDLCRWRAACIARMNESLGSDSLLFCRPIRFSSPSRCATFLYAGDSFLSLIHHFTLFPCLNPKSRTPLTATPSSTCIRLLPAVYI